MPERVQVKRTPHVSPKEAEEIAARDAAEQEAVEKAQSSTSETEDDLLDEIDAMIEENEVLVNYRQRGGQ